jgi:ABC-2 type transport system ATP-binding protein
VVPHRDADLGVLCDVLHGRGLRARVDGGRVVVDVGGTPPDDLAASVNRAAFDAGMVLVELQPLRTTLEDRYLSLVSGGSR